MINSIFHIPISDIQEHKVKFMNSRMSKVSYRSIPILQEGAYLELYPSYPPTIESVLKKHGWGIDEIIKINGIIRAINIAKSEKSDYVHICLGDSINIQQNKHPNESYKIYGDISDVLYFSIRADQFDFFSSLFGVYDKPVNFTFSYDIIGHIK